MPSDLEAVGVRLEKHRRIRPAERDLNRVAIDELKALDKFRRVDGHAASSHTAGRPTDITHLAPTGEANRLDHQRATIPLAYGMSECSRLVVRALRIRMRAPVRVDDAAAEHHRQRADLDRLRIRLRHELRQAGSLCAVRTLGVGIRVHDAAGAEFLLYGSLVVLDLLRDFRLREVLPLHESRPGTGTRILNDPFTVEVLQ